ncbi:hypothetical protein TNIN_193571 [Trichonephila inaurata madagascariensis]|uniref:Uncharacterized protein n=1 Tax=Trichonephila inaurata madagascariensis TaxID=2747483 RepID=A0A8X6XI88_9ARAC|nr:hypothetical protein TNIN_193571 [Trichonephila inaurata madagascariensis]
MARTKQTARKTAQNLPPPTDHDICNELMMIQMRLELLRSQMTVTEKFLIRCRLGDIKILPLHDEMSEMREKRDEQKRQFDADIGELTLLGSCPVNCLYHTEYDPLNMYNILNDLTQKELASFEEKLKSEIAAKNKLTPPKEMIDKTETAKMQQKITQFSEKIPVPRISSPPQNLQRSKKLRRMTPLVLPHPLR